MKYYLIFAMACWASMLASSTPLAPIQETIEAQKDALRNLLVLIGLNDKKDDQLAVAFDVALNGQNLQGGNSYSNSYSYSNSDSYSDSSYSESS